MQPEHGAYWQHNKQAEDSGNDGGSAALHHSCSSADPFTPCFDRQKMFSALSSVVSHGPWAQEPRWTRQVATLYVCFSNKSISDLCHYLLVRV